MYLPSFLVNLFDSKVRQHNTWLCAVPENQRPALASVLEGKTDFRDHQELGDLKARLCVEHTNGRVGVDVTVSELPEGATFVRPTVGLGLLLPYYTVQSSVELVPAEPVVLKATPFVLRSGEVRKLAL